MADRLGASRFRLAVHADVRLPRRAVAGFALGSLGPGVYSTVPTVLLLYFCTEVLRIAPVVGAAIAFVPKAWAIVWDPVVGAWSDRTRSRLGRRAPFLLAGAVAVAAGFAMLFNVPELPAGVTIAWVAGVYFAMASAYSLFAVPYVAIPAEISPSAAERERLMAWRMVVSMAGVLIGAGIAPHLVEWAGGGRRGYAWMSLMVAALCLVAMLTTYRTVRRYHAADVVDAPPDDGLAAGLRRIGGDRGYVRLWMTYLLALSGASLFTATVPYFVTRVLQQGEGAAGTALLALLGSTIVALPAWARALRRYDGWSLLGVAVVGYAAVAAAFLLPQGASGGFALGLYALLGVPFAGLQLIPFALLAHIAHATGQREEGLYTGIWTAGEKLALAIGPAAAGLGLTWVGYVPGALEQAPATLSGLQALMAIGPACFLAPSLLLVMGRREPTSAGRTC